MRRLGYLLDLIGQRVMAEPLHVLCEQRRYVAADALASSAARSGIVDSRWRIDEPRVGAETSRPTRISDTRHLWLGNQQQLAGRTSAFQVLVCKRRLVEGIAPTDAHG